MIDGKTYFGIKCNRCGEVMTDDGEHSHWESVESALEMAGDDGLVADHGLMAVCLDCLNEYGKNLANDDRFDALMGGDIMETYNLKMWAKRNSVEAR